MQVRAEGRFVKKHLFLMSKYGQYRGAGILEVHDSGLRIQGRHVYPLGARWAFGLGVFFGALIVTSGLFAPGLIIMYLVVEYWWLKREDLDLPFSAITGVAVDERKQLVGVRFNGHQWCSPAVLKSTDFKAVADALKSVVRPATAA